MTVILRGFIGICLGMLLVYPQDAQAFVGRKAPEITSPVWINSEPKSLSSLRGKVVLMEFWTFGCFNCRNVEPQIKKWHQNYVDSGLVVIGIHSPEFAYERNIDSVKRYVKKNAIAYSVAIDDDFAIWNRYANRYWPAIYLIDKQGIIRYIRVGEGGYTETEEMIRKLLFG